jgi:acyl-CoA reductase-like NAD-dependent aldehyde dehydrogenase
MDIVALDRGLADLHDAKDQWAAIPLTQRIQILQQIKDNLMQVAEGWATTAARKKLIPHGSPLVGEEWISGPYGLMMACNGLMETLSKMQDRSYLTPLRKRRTASGQLAVRVLPHKWTEHLLLSGVTAEVWMQQGVTAQNLAQNTAHDHNAKGAVALVLGAGNIAAISPLDVLHKLFSQNQVVILKMNPVNDYLADYLTAALRPLIDLNALRIVRGGGDVGAYLCNHDLVEEVHITGAAATHDKIVWGDDTARITPKLTKRITSELGGVGPTIVVPGPWSARDLAYQAENIATQKLHNSGFNCIACQMLILPRDWAQKSALMNNLARVIAHAPPRGAYYPGAMARMQDFAAQSGQASELPRKDAPPLVFVPNGGEWFAQNEIFAPALTTHEIAGDDPEAFLIAAVKYANDQLYGTLGANIVIHPATMRKIGKARFDAILADLRYGAIAINGWTGIAFLVPACTWGGFPGSTLADVGSGIGTAHNTMMFDRSERVVVTAPWRQFPRNLGLSGLLPRPPWFITNRRAAILGKLLTQFEHRPNLLKLPRILWHALQG